MAIDEAGAGIPAQYGILVVCLDRSRSGPGPIDASPRQTSHSRVGPFRKKQGTVSSGGIGTQCRQQRFGSGVIGRTRGMVAKRNNNRPANGSGNPGRPVVRQPRCPGDTQNAPPIHGESRNHVESDHIQVFFRLLAFWVGHDGLYRSYPTYHLDSHATTRKHKVTRKGKNIRRYDYFML